MFIVDLGQRACSYTPPCSGLGAGAVGGRDVQEEGWSRAVRDEEGGMGLEAPFPPSGLVW